MGNKMGGEKMDKIIKSRFVRLGIGLLLCLLVWHTSGIAEEKESTTQYQMFLPKEGLPMNPNWPDAPLYAVSPIRVEWRFRKLKSKMEYDFREGW